MNADASGRQRFVGAGGEHGPAIPPAARGQSRGLPDWDRDLGGAGGAADRRRARGRIESVGTPTVPIVPSGGRRLTAAERQALQERRRAREPAPAPAPAPEATPRLSPPATTPRRTRKSVPKMPRSRQQTTVTSRPLVALGAVLLVGLTVLAFAGSRLFGAAGGGDDGSAREVAGVVPPAAFPVPDASPELPFVAPAASTPVAATNGHRAPIVCLDPGHGGPDSGFTRYWSPTAPEMQESVLTLEHAWDLEARLKQLGYTVVLTRRTDVAVDANGADVNGDGKTGRDDPPGTNKYATLDELQARINICNNAHADLLLSMHVNGYSTSKPRGYETWYTPAPARPFGDLNEEFAGLVYTQLKAQLAAIGYVLPQDEERGVNPDSAADVQNEHSIFQHFVLLGPAVPGEIVPSNMPGAIAEALFISNDGDAAVLASPEGRDAIVTAYENAIVAYFQAHPPQ